MKYLQKDWLVLFILIFFVICFFNSRMSMNENEYMTRKIEKTELFGNWYLSNETLELLTKEGVDIEFLMRDNSMLKIEENHSFTCKIPFNISTGSKKQYEHFILKGKWEIQKKIEGKYIQNILLLNNLEATPFSIILSFYVTEIEGELILWRYLEANPKKIYVFRKK